jgi:phosphopantetheinyl transferase (holo-ACP synthase)
VPVQTLASCTVARRLDWIAGRRAAKDAVATHCAVSPAKVRVINRPGAAPIALFQSEDACWSTLPLSISISHHDGHGLAAVVDSPARVGVDLARVGEIEPEHHRYFLAPSEWPIAERIGATAVWALKEAAWKALSLSPDTPFSALELVMETELRGLLFDGRWTPARARTWRFADDLIAAAVYIEGEVQ